MEINLYRNLYGRERLTSDLEKHKYFNMSRSELNESFPSINLLKRHRFRNNYCINNYCINN